ncbi:MAG TPA: hypothetical protein VGL05_21695 [Kribbella sp.]
MTDDLKNKLEQLVADPPPPSTVPSEAVFARVRTVRRRRTAGALTLTAAAVVAVAFAVNNVTDIDGRPPISNTPSIPAPTPTPSAPGTTGATSSTHVSGAVNTTNTRNTNPPVSPHTNTPPPASTTNSSNTPVAPQLGLHLTLKPSVSGRVVTVKVTAQGTVRVPIGDETSGSFFSDLGSERYTFGDGQETGSDAGAVNCTGAHTTRTGQETRALIDWNSTAPTPPSNHTYAKAGTYTVSYTVKYCGNHGWVPVTRTAKVTVK